MARQDINVSTPNDNLGDPLRDANIKINDNFIELYDKSVFKVAGKDLSTNDFTNTEQTKLSGIEAGAEVNVQADWNQTDSLAPDFIKNKTSAAPIDPTPIDSSVNAVQSGGVFDALALKANISQLHDAVTVSDSSEIDFTLTGQDITASIIAGSIDVLKLDAALQTDSGKP